MPQPVRSEGTTSAARRLFQQGRYARAATLCEQLLQSRASDADALELLGMSRLAMGRVNEGVNSLQQAIALEPTRAAAWVGLAEVHTQSGRLREAISLYRAALLHTPDSHELLFRLGAAEQAAGALLAALESYQRCLAVNPDSAEVLNNLGTVLDRLGREAEAIEALQRAVGVNPRYVRALNNLGKVLRQAGRLTEALQALEQARSIEPNNAATLVNFGLALLPVGRVTEAVRCLRRAIAREPQLPEAHHALAQALLAAGDSAEALHHFEQAARLRPGDAAMWVLWGRTLLDHGYSTRAVAVLERAVQLGPYDAEAHCQLGYALGSRARPEQALMSYESAVRLDPRHFIAQLSRGRTLALKQRFVEAIASLEAAAAVRPDDPTPVGELLYCYVKMCDWQGVARQRARLQALPLGLRTMHPFALMAVADDPADYLASARMQAEIVMRARPPMATAPRYRHERLRVAYLSWDYFEHATTALVSELFELHDRAAFEVVGVSYGPSDDTGVRERIVGACDRFIECADQSDAQIARWLREQEIDIAVDLKGYTSFARSGILAYRPAPVQVNYLGYPGTMGAEFLDYLIADEFLIPEADRSFYTEKIAYLPGSYQVNDRRRRVADATPTRREAGLPEQGFVFCCFNNNWKITATMFEVWMRLLRQVPDSVLWLLQDNPDAVENLRREATVRGVAAERLVFGGRISNEHHLARHRLADLFLDTLPVNAHTTASDALWTGLPVLTCAGRAFPARVAGSLLHAVGLPELIAASLAEYEQLALAFASEPQRLAPLRARLMHERGRLALFDTPAYCRHLEAAYRHMWQRHQQGRAPECFKVADEVRF